MGTEELTNRLKRVEGQIRGLQRMVDERRDCEAVLEQLMAARSALDQVGLLIAHSFINDSLCAPDAAVDSQRVGRVLELIFSRFSVSAVEREGSPQETAESIEE